MPGWLMLGIAMHLVRLTLVRAVKINGLKMEAGKVGTRDGVLRRNNQPPPRQLRDLP